MPFFILFLIVPMIEVFLFLTVGQWIGIGTTLMLAIVTAILGGAIVRHQGLQALRDAQAMLRHGEMPLDTLFDGICIAAAGALLMSPGFLTDTIGFLLLIPVVRAFLRSMIAKHARAQHTSRTYDGDIIDVEYEQVDDRRS